ncbi:hypothetical protein PU634_04245 [Oceanimonas pelagia]|uniref:Lipoprotein n=1 Tax=Oceanimonas pelagia TaxID=3028314 RepID=A0AA50KPZ7_9GAMM|nr:hypothetical protein [Oceanimonas pelagia]WMC11578.1 hypothetical protein PU634_04245 [Oceanimonas pelagia]
MKQHLPALFAILSVLSALTGCEPHGPAAKVEDHIDEVMETGLHAGEPTALPAPRPEPEVMAQQQKRHRQVLEQASRAAEQKLDEILQDTRP